MIRNASIYPEDAILNGEGLDVIGRNEAATLDELFRERVRRSPNAVAYQQYDEASHSWSTITWAELAIQVERWQVAFRGEGLQKGDRVAICYKNSIEWVVFDQAALRLGLVVVPLYASDRVENISYVLSNSGAKLALFSSSANAQEVLACDDELSLTCVLVVHADGQLESDQAKVRMVAMNEWLPEDGQHLERGLVEPDDLASIIYTSGTTGRPKGVMLSHRNIISNVYNGMRSMALKQSDMLLSFLPLSHALERTIGYYAPLMCGSCVTFNRSIPQLAEDILEVKPTVLISVPRIFERIHNKIHADIESSGTLKQLLFHWAINVGWHRFEHSQNRRSWHPKLVFAPLLNKLVGQVVRDKLGGQLNYVIVGGAALSPVVSKTFLSLGVNLLQGYGLTESSPVLTVNTLEHNRPDTIGLPLNDVLLKIEEGDELWAKGENIMQGYWQNPESTADTMSGDWLKTGDRAKIDEQGFIQIVGRIKEIIVLANGEKVPPNDIEFAITNDPLFEQAMVLGEGKSYLTALVVLNERAWKDFAVANQLDAGALDSEKVQTVLLDRVSQQMEEFPGYARIRKIHLSTSVWSQEDGLLTPTLKLKRLKIMARFQEQIDQLYSGHEVRK